MEFILVGLQAVSASGRTYESLTYLQVAQLGKLLATVIEFTFKGLSLLMHCHVSADIPSLCKSLVTHRALIGALAGVPAFVSLQYR
jgi:hypothetical protein